MRTVKQGNTGGAFTFHQSRFPYHMFRMHAMQVEGALGRRNRHHIPRRRHRPEGQQSYCRPTCILHKRQFVA